MPEPVVSIRLFICVVPESLGNLDLSGPCFCSLLLVFPLNSIVFSPMINVVSTHYRKKGRRPRERAARRETTHNPTGGGAHFISTWLDFLLDLPIHFYVF